MEAGGRGGHSTGVWGTLTSREQRIPIAKHATKPFTLVPQLSEEASTTWNPDTITQVHTRTRQSHSTHENEKWR